jgi:hypothetical protein
MSLMAHPKHFFAAAHIRIGQADPASLPCDFPHSLQTLGITIFQGDDFIILGSKLEAGIEDDVFCNSVSRARENDAARAHCAP